LGKFGDLLTRSLSFTEADGRLFQANGVPEMDIIGTLDRCVKLHNADLTTKGIVLNALAKLSTRFSSQCLPAIQRILQPFRNSMSLELQQRSVEYNYLLSSNMEGIRRELLVKMPIFEESKLAKRRDQSFGGSQDSPTNKMGGDNLLDSGVSNITQSAAPVASFNVGGAGGAKTSIGGSSLLDNDLLDIFGGGGSGPAATNSTAQTYNSTSLDIFGVSGGNTQSPVKPMNNNQTNQSIMDIFGNNSNSPVQQQTNMGNNIINNNYNSNSNNNSNNNNNVLLGMGLGAPVINTTPPSIFSNNSISTSSNMSISAFDKDGLNVLIELSKPNPSSPDLSRLLCKFSNTLGAQIDNLQFQAAVPKYLKLEMLPASSSSVPPQSQGRVTQEIKITNSMQGEKNIMLKLKITYSVNGRNVEEMAQVNNFPNLF
jgi:AP-1 complex subunit gamma-1